MRRPYVPKNNFEHNEQVVNKIIKDFNEQHYRQKFLTNLPSKAMAEFSSPSNVAILGKARSRELEQSKEFWQKKVGLMGPEVKNFTGVDDPFLQEVLADKYDTQLNRDVNRLMPGNTVESLDPNLYDKFNARLGNPMDAIAFMVLQDQPAGISSDSKLWINYGQKSMPHNGGERPGPRNYIPPPGGEKNFQIENDPIPNYHDSPIDIVTPSNSSRVLDADYWNKSMGIPSRPMLIRSDARGGPHGTRFKLHAGIGHHKFGRHQIGGFMLKNYGFQPMGRHWVHNSEMGKIKNILGEASLNMVSAAMKSSRNKKYMKHLVASGGNLKDVLGKAVKSKTASSIKNAIKLQAMKNLPAMSKAISSGRAGISSNSITENLGNLQKIYGEGKNVKNMILPKIKKLFSFLRRKKTTVKKSTPVPPVLKLNPPPVSTKKKTSDIAPLVRRRKGGAVKKLNFLNFI